jgi:excisionase family DNA binding protein
MSTMSNIPGYLELAEVARRLKVHYSQAARYVQNKKLPHIAVGKSKLVPENAVLSFVKAPRGNPTFQTPQKKKRK